LNLFYIPHEKKSGSPICVLNKPDNLVTSKGVTKAWKDHDFVSEISGTGDIVMEWTQTNKSDLGKSCVLTVENFTASKIQDSDPEVRNWFCKGNFKKEGLENTPIVVSDGVGQNRQNKNRVEYKNAKFSLALNNAISKEKQSGASTILRVFLN
jgi:hypothetical protein